MKKRMWAVLALAGALAMGVMAGCAVPQQTMEEDKGPSTAEQDSLRDIELKKAKMFAYENMRNREWQRAKGYAWQVVELDVKNEHNVWHWLYNIYTELDQVDSAIVVLDMGLGKQPEDPWINSTRAFFYKKEGNYEKALEHYRKALAAEPENIDYLNETADVYESLKMWDEAIATYEKILELDPDRLEAKEKLTALIRDHRDPEQYIEVLKQEIAENPDDIRKRLDLIVAYADKNEDQPVLEQANAILERAPDNVEAYRWKAKALENLNRLPEAIESWKNLLEHNPGYNKARLNIADYYRELKQYANSRTWVVKARNAVDGPVPEADIILANVYFDCALENMGNETKFDDAVTFLVSYRIYQDVVSADPAIITDFTIVDKAQRRIEFIQNNELLPQPRHKHFNPGKYFPYKKEGYEWIQQGWAEWKVVKPFVDSL